VGPRRVRGERRKGGRGKLPVPITTLQVDAFDYLKTVTCPPKITMILWAWPKLK